MADLSKKTKYINMVVRKKDLNISTRDEFIHKWVVDNCENYAYIYHYHDVALTGVEEDEHLHLVCVMKEAKRLSTILNSFCECVAITTLGVEIDKCNSIEGSIQYLIHKNDPQKTPHEVKEIFHNYGDEINVYLTVNCENITPQRLRYLCKTCQSNYELIEALGLSNYIKYRKVIADIKDDFRIWNY